MVNMSGKIEKNAIQSAIINTVKALDKAQKFAEETRDVESLVVIADRWLNAAYKIKGLDKPPSQMLGFIQDELEQQREDDADTELHSEPK